jgi:hypothetical protein
MMTDRNWQALFFEACGFLQILESALDADGNPCCEVCGGSPDLKAASPDVRLYAGSGHTPDCDLGRLMAIYEADRPR